MSEPARGYMPVAARDDWRTPPEVLEPACIALDVQQIPLDPCPAPEGPWFAGMNLYQPAFDGLREVWDRPWFCNPPFKHLRRWAAKAAKAEAPGVLLLPARTDTRAWHESVITAARICSWRGRITFVGAKDPAPFPVAFAYWGPEPWLFELAFSPRGHVYRP